MKPKTITLSLAIFFLLSVSGGLIVYYGMEWGPWAYNDSAAYVSAARNIASGNGLVIVHSSGKISTVLEFPPLFPFLISLFGGSDLNYNSVIKFWNIFLFAGSIFFFTNTAYVLTKNILISVTTGLFLIVNRLVLSTYMSAMSEPLFLFILIVCLFLYAMILKTDNRRFRFALIGISALLPLTRIAGILFVGIFGVALLMHSKKLDSTQKIKETLFFYFGSYLPVAVWFFVRYLTYGKVGGKRLELDRLNFKSFIASLEKIFSVVRDWIPYVKIYKNTHLELPIAIGFIVALIMLMIFAMIKLNRGSNQQKNNNLQFLIMLILIACCYLVFICVIHVISIPQIDVIDRMLVPILPILLLMIAVAAHAFIHPSFIGKTIPIALLLISLFFLRHDTLISRTFIHSMHREGSGFNSRALQESGLIDELNKVADNHVMASNTAGFVLYHTNIYPFQIDQFPNHKYGIGNSYGEREFRYEDGRLVILFSDFENYYGENAETLLETITYNLAIEYIDDVGAIYSF